MSAPSTVTLTVDEYMAPSVRRNDREAELQRQRAVMKGYLRVKLREEDWHGVQDAASDLRDIDSELAGLRY